MDMITLSDWQIEYGNARYSAKVPGDILIDLYTNGVIEDPYFGQNAEKVRHHLDNPVKYIANFNVCSLNKKTELIFEGIDTYSKIYLNGSYVGHTENMFLRYAFDVSGIIREGENILVVEMSPYKDHIDDGYHGRGVFNSLRLQLRKAQCHFGWDWAPNLPGYGIWLPVYLRISDGNCIDYCCPITDGQGNVCFEVEVQGSGILEIYIDEKPFGRFEAKPGANKVFLKYEKPELWYPNGYGKQPLYSYRVALVEGQEIKDVKEGRLAFRDIRVCEEKTDDGRIDFKFEVNGERIFAYGSNWVPCSNQTGAVPDDEYRTLLRYAKDGGINMLRVWGGGIYEKEIFYDLCDEYGILVWQDLMFSCQDPPENVNIIERVAPELEYQLKRLRRHCCVAIICGGNEWPTDNRYNNEPLLSFLRECSQKYIPELRFIPGSPFGYSGYELEAADSGDTHVSSFFTIFLREDLTGYRKYIDQNRAQFYSECAVLGSCRMRSLKKFLNEEDIWPIGANLDYHFLRHPFDIVPGRTYAMMEAELATGLFGEITSAEDFVKKSMIAHSEVLGAEIDYARANKDCHGFLNWMYNDNWGCGTWSVVDKYMELKPAYYALKRSFKEIVVRYVLRDNRFRLVVANRSLADYPAKVSFGAKTLDGSVLWEEKAEITVKKGNVAVILDGADTSRGDYLFARLEDGKDNTILFLKEFTSYTWETDLDVSQVEKGENGLTIAIKANKFARCVFIDYPTPISCSDNYFDLEKGETKNVTIRFADEADYDKITVKTFSDVWTD